MHEQPDVSLHALNIQAASTVERNLAAIGLGLDIDVALTRVSAHGETSYSVSRRSRDLLIRNPEPGVLQVEV